MSEVNELTAAARWSAMRSASLTTMSLSAMTIVGRSTSLSPISACHRKQTARRTEATAGRALFLRACTTRYDSRLVAELVSAPEEAQSTATTKAGKRPRTPPSSYRLAVSPILSHNKIRRTSPTVLRCHTFHIFCTRLADIRKAPESQCLQFRSVRIGKSAVSHVILSNRQRRNATKSMTTCKLRRFTFAQ